MKRLLLVLLLVGSLFTGSALATPPTEPTYPGEGDILTAAWLYDAFHRLYVWATAYEAGALRVIFERQTSTAGQTVFTLTNTYPLGKGRIHLFVNGIYQGTASGTNLTTPAFSETTTNSVTTTTPAPLASWSYDFMILKTYGE
jgi:hypothetical protein